MQIPFPLKQIIQTRIERMSNGLDAITDVKGIRVGHATDIDAITGCTVILCEDGAVGGVDQRGGAPGTRETDLLGPMHSVEDVNAVLLAGGSAFGLAAADGVMRYLAERGKGYKVGIPGVPNVPIVPGAVLFDLGIGSADVRPDADMGYAACQIATDEKPEQGSVGAGTGATVGKLLGAGSEMKGGIGTASADLGGGLVVGAIVAVNCVGDVVDPDQNAIIAGTRKANSAEELADTQQLLTSFMVKTVMRLQGASTVIGVVATNAKLDKNGANKVAQMAHNGLARTIRPAHTMMDGDTIFTMATGKKHASINLIGAFAADVVARAILNGIRAATSLGGRPTAADITPQPIRLNGTPG